MFLLFPAAWSPVKGGAQDMNYWKYGCMECTMEVSCCKYPPASSLEQYWKDNSASLVEYLNQANTGIRGIIKFQNGNTGVNLTVSFDSREPYFKTSSDGEYYRILLPGSYKLKVLLECNSIYETSITVPTNTKLLVYNITLSNELYPNYLSANLNRYAVFCSITNTTNISNQVNFSISTFLFFILYLKSDAIF